MTKKSLSETNKEIWIALQQAQKALRLPEGAVYMIPPQSLGGYTPEEAFKGARLMIGRDFSTLELLLGKRVVPGTLPIGRFISPGEVEGKILSVATLVRVILSQRFAYTGDYTKVGATAILAQGVYEGGEEESVLFEIGWDERGPTLLEFSFNQLKQNIIDMSETACSGLAQKEIRVDFDDGARRTIVRVSPSGLPAPGDALDAEIERLTKIERLKLKA